MSRYATNVPRQGRKPDSVNLAGGNAYKQESKLALASLVTTALMPPTGQYYRTGPDIEADAKRLISEVDPLFAAKAAVYARNADGLRSITHLVGAEVARTGSGRPWVKDFLSAVVRRPDDATEILAYYLSRYGKPLPNGLKKGLGLALGKFDGYSLARYRGEDKDISLVDVVNLCHPKPTAKNGTALAQLVKGELRQSQTFESKLSAAGKDEEAKTAVWADLLSERGKLGYMALLKNLRNIAEQAPELVGRACELLVDEKSITTSLVLPFRFVTAYRMVGSNPHYAKALSQALDISLANVPSFPNALVVVDGSQSMGSPVAGNQEMTCKYVGSLLAATIYRKNLADVMVFGDSAGPVRGLNPADSVLTTAEKIQNTSYGWSTNFPAIFEAASKKYDTVIILSDMQAWVADGYGYSQPGPALERYRKRTGARPDIFAFDLAGYGYAQFPAPQVYQLAGFTDSTLKIMALLKEDRDAFVRKIEEVTF